MTDREIFLDYIAETYGKPLPPFGEAVLNGLIRSEVQAATGDLLAACEALLPVAKQYMVRSLHPASSFPEIAKAEAAIAKARSEDPQP